MEDKQLIEKLKLIGSSLFGRTMPYLVFGCPVLNDNQIIYSNIPLEEMEIYEPSVQYFLHQVTINDNVFFTALMEKFPILRSHIVLLNMNKLLAVLNKNEKVFNMISLVVNGTDVFIKVNKELTPCGSIISEFMSELYYSTFLQGYVTTENQYSKTLIPADISTDKLTYITVLNHPENFLGAVYFYKLALINGKSTISTKEFITKSKLKEYTIELIAGGTIKDVQVCIKFTSEFLDVLSVQPNIRHYPITHNQTKES